MLRLEPGQIFSHYRIIEQLGQGGQATAYKAEDIRLQRLVVIKTLLPELAATGMNSNHMKKSIAGGANILFMDIHVEWRNIRDMHTPAWGSWSNSRWNWF